MKEKLVSSLLERLSDDLLYGQWHIPEGTSTRSFVVDDCFPAEAAAEIYAAFPKDAVGFTRTESFKEHKSIANAMGKFPQILSDAIFAFQDHAVISRISRITNISNLEPDPLFYAGGLSMMFKGDFLNPHIDNSHDRDRKRYRRLNLLYYASPNWTLESGGNFELWDERGRTPKQIVSAANRLVVMETTKTSLHSVNPVRVVAPRCCLSNYFFSKKSPTGSDYYHVTSFLARPEQPIRRLYSHVDNAARQFVASKLGVSRGRNKLNVP